MGYYVYKYVKNNIIEYIGITINLDERIRQHTKDKLKNFTGQIYYFECKNKTAMKSWEYVLINKYHPKYNEALKDNSININIEEPDWKLYMDTTSKIIDISKHLNQSTISKNDISKTEIISGPRAKIFTCRRCNTVFKTINYYYTKTKCGAYCPTCKYATYTTK